MPAISAVKVFSRYLNLEPLISENVLAEFNIFDARQVVKKTKKKRKCLIS